MSLVGKCSLLFNNPGGGGGLCSGVPARRGSILGPSACRPKRTLKSHFWAPGALGPGACAVLPTPTQPPWVGQKCPPPRLPEHHPLGVQPSLKRSLIHRGGGDPLTHPPPSSSFGPPNCKNSDPWAKKAAVIDADSLSHIWCTPK